MFSQLWLELRSRSVPQNMLEVKISKDRAIISHRQIEHVGALQTFFWVYQQPLVNFGQDSAGSGPQAQHVTESSA